LDLLEIAAVRARWKEEQAAGAIGETALRRIIAVELNFAR
jgi:hypothetical protein